MLRLKITAEKWPKVKVIIGSSGTIRAVAKISKKVFCNEWIEKGDLESLIRGMESLKPSQLAKIPGMEPKRVDMILAGAILLDECMGALGAKVVYPTDFSLRDGILEEERELIEKGKKYHLSLHLEDLYRKAKLFRKDENHLRATVRIAESLFHGIRTIHKLDSEWCAYLSAATILRDIGELISISNHSEHTSYIIKNCDLPPMEEWEVDLISDLCLLHEGAKFDLKAVKLNARKVKHSIFLKLLGMLRIVNSVDTNPKKVISIQSISLTKHAIHLVVPRKEITGLENQYLEIEKEFFERVFRRSVKVIARV
jgi:exopolyphosphatase/guanosine-5'-triphosphate,3'-diphosphate pyrophosphatase